MSEQGPPASGLENVTSGAGRRVARGCAAVLGLVVIALLALSIGAPARNARAFGGGSASVGQERAGGAAAVRALIDRHAPELRIDSLTFMFLAPVPVRSSIRVKFGSDGRVTAVDGPFERAD